MCTAVSTSHAPLASTRTPADGPTASRTAATSADAPGVAHLDLDRRVAADLGDRERAVDERVHGDRVPQRGWEAEARSLLRGSAARPRDRPGSPRAASTRPIRPGRRAASPRVRRCAGRTRPDRARSRQAQPHAHEDGHHQLQARRGDQRGDQRRRVARGQHQPHRLHGQWQREQPQQRPRLRDTDRDDRKERAHVAHDEQSPRACDRPCAPRACACRSTVSVGTSRTLLASRIAHASRPTTSAPHHAGAGHVLRPARTRSRRWRRSRRTRAPSPRRARGSRRASGRRCRARRRRWPRHRRAATMGSRPATSTSPATAATRKLSAAARVHRLSVSRCRLR